MGETTHQVVGETTQGRRVKRLTNGGRNDSGAKRLRAKRLRANGKVGETTRYRMISKLPFFGLHGHRFKLRSHVSF